MITCPVCGVTAEPSTVQGPVAVCGNCGFTLHVDDAGTVTRATLAQIETLTDRQVQALRDGRRGLVKRAKGA